MAAMRSSTRSLKAASLSLRIIKRDTAVAEIEPSAERNSSSEIAVGTSASSAGACGLDPLPPLVATLAADENRASAMAAKQLKLEPPLAASFCKGQLAIAYSFLSRYVDPRPLSRNAEIRANVEPDGDRS